jgi:endoglucanase
MFKTLPKLCQLSACALSLALAGLCSSAMAEVQPLSVQGNKVLVGGKSVALEGISMFWSNTDFGAEKWYTADTVKRLKTNYNANLVRAAIGHGLHGGIDSDWNGNMARLDAVVQAAIDNDMYVIVDYHSHIAHTNKESAKTFFGAVARKWGGYPNVIYEIYNEPSCWTNDKCGEVNPFYTWDGDVRPYAQNISDFIRTIDPDNLIVIGTPKWSQDVDVASRNKVNGSNLAYTIHFYANGHRQWLRDKAQIALNNGAALFATEWAASEPSGDGPLDKNEANKWMEFLRANKISHAGWSYHDKPESSSFLNADGSLKESGHYIKAVLAGRENLSTEGDNCATAAAAAINSTIQAESYCAMSGIQTETTGDTGGGKNVGWIDFNDWMNYKVNVPRTGMYKVSYRVASKVESGYLQLETAGGTPSYGTLQFPATGDWQNWTTVSHLVNLPAGEQTLAIKALSGGWNINWLQIEAVGGSSSSLSSSSSSSSSANSLTHIATVQAESYSYMSGVQIENTSDVGGGQNVGYIDAGDWMSYVNTPINLPSAGTYEIEFRVASKTNGANFNLEEAGGAPVYAAVNVGATGDWQNWTSVKLRVNLPAGQRKLGIKANNSGWNINWFKISKVN